MKQIPLTQGKFALVDDEDYEWLIQWKWRCSGNGYAVRDSPTVNGKRSTISMHCQIMNPPAGLEVDHEHQNTLDNRRSELRVCTHAENLQGKKRHKNNTTGFKGIMKNGRGFGAQIQKDGKRLHLGTYATPEEAAHAYDEAAKKYFGEFAKFNFERSA